MAKKAVSLWHMVVGFVRDALGCLTHGGLRYHVWMGVLTFLMILGSYAYWIQLRDGLVVTGMNDHIIWGLYISNFTFWEGIASAAVMLLLPFYILQDTDFVNVIVVGKCVAVAALVMSLAFVVFDIGGPHRGWHLLPIVGFFNFPSSMLAWDVVMVNGFLVINMAIPAYLLFANYFAKGPSRKVFVPLVFAAILWAVVMHLATAFLYAGLSARPFWHSSLLGPRFLASAFSGGAALTLVVLVVLRKYTAFTFKNMALQRLAWIATIAAQVNIVMLASEFFKEFYFPTEHSHSAMYLFLGLHGHKALVPWIWLSIAVILGATGILMVSRLRRDVKVLFPTCIALFLAIWVEKGLSSIVPGFIPSSLGEIVEYVPTWVEVVVSVGVLAMGLFILTVLLRVAAPIQMGKLKFKKR